MAHVWVTRRPLGAYSEKSVSAALQGTEDGKPTEQHRCYKSPEGGKLDIILYGMKDQVGRPSRPHLRGCRTTIRVESGVDVGLGVAMQEMPGPREEPYSVVIVITGDGDLERAFKRSPHVVYVCSLKASTSSSLEPFVKVAFDGRRIYLEDIMMGAYKEQLCMNFGAMRGHEEDGAGGGGMMKKEARLTKCFAGRICEKLNDPDHMSRFRHPCPDGPGCRFIYEDPKADERGQEERKHHLMHFGHICSQPNCPFQDELNHKAVCEHPRVGKPICPEGDRCPRVWDPDHAREWRHRCPDDRKCALMKRVQTDAQKADHMRNYMHTCSFGKACLYIRDPEWNWEHMLQFTHPRRSCVEVLASTRGGYVEAGGGKIRDDDSTVDLAVTQLSPSAPPQAEAEWAALKQEAHLAVPPPYVRQIVDVCPMVAKAGGNRFLSVAGVDKPPKLSEGGVEVVGEADEVKSLSDSISELSVASGMDSTATAWEPAKEGSSCDISDKAWSAGDEDRPRCSHAGCANVGLLPGSLCMDHGGRGCRWTDDNNARCGKNVEKRMLQIGCVLCRSHLLKTDQFDSKVDEFLGVKMSKVDDIDKRILRRKYFAKKYPRGDENSVKGQK